MVYRPGERILSFCTVGYVSYGCRLCRCDRDFVTVRQCCHCCGFAFCDCDCVALFTIRYGVFILGMSTSVILPASVSGFNLKFSRVLRDFQGAVRRANAVVLCKRAFVQLVSERVLTLADNCLAAGDVICCTFTVHEAIAADRHVALRVLHKRSSIVLLLSASTRQRDASLRHFQSAVICRIIIVRIRCFNLVVYSTEVLDARNCLTPCLAAIRAVQNRCAFCHARRCSTFMRLPIILSAIIYGFDGHLSRRDCQLARDEGLRGIVSGNVLTISIHNGIGFCKCTSIRINIRSLCRRIGDCQDIAFAEAFNCVKYRISIFDFNDLASTG